MRSLYEALNLRLPQDSTATRLTGQDAEQYGVTQRQLDQRWRSHYSHSLRRHLGGVCLQVDGNVLYHTDRIKNHPFESWTHDDILQFVYTVYPDGHLLSDDALICQL